MNIYFRILPILLIILFTNCEKDDICDSASPTTPSLVVEFFDINTPSETKKVTNLKVIGEGMTEGVIFNPTTTGNSRYLANTSKIKIPLKTAEDSTTFKFILNYGNTNPAYVNTDVLKFNYTRQNIYVSRACGYKTIYSFKSEKPVEHTDNATPDILWIVLPVLEVNNIENENETHLKIYF